MLLQNGLIVGLFMFLIGIALFAVGLYFYKKKQLIADTPTSKIRSIAMGLVEIFGQVIPIKERLCQNACPHHQSNRLVACSANFVSLGGHALRGKVQLFSIDPPGCEIIEM